MKKKKWQSYHQKSTNNGEHLLGKRKNNLLSREGQRQGPATIR